MSVGLAGCRLLRPAHLADQLEITWAAPGRRSFPTRLTKSLGICIKTGPDHTVVADGRTLLYPADAVSVRPPGCVWSTPAQGSGFLSIDIAPSLLPEAGVHGSMRFLPRKAILGLEPAIRALLAADSAFRAEEIVTRLLDSMIDVDALSSDAIHAGSRRPSAIDRVREFFEAELDRRPTLEEAAGAAGLDKFALLRQFRRNLHTTPHAFLVMLRLERARELLARGVPPSEAAVGAGFADQAHLTRWFRRANGITPAAYAREVRSTYAIA
jgi:AraC-like DNA-binding protein